MEYELIRTGVDHRSSGKRGRRALAPTGLALLACLPAVAIAWTGLGAARREPPVTMRSSTEIGSITVQALPVRAADDNDLGVARANGYGVERDDRRALELFMVACADGSAEGCSNQGAMLEQGRGAPMDLAQALALYRQACEGGSAIGCSNLGALYLEMAGSGADLTYLRELFDWACQKGSAAGCENRAALERRRAPKPVNRI